MFLFLLTLTIFLRFFHLQSFAGFSWDQEQLLAFPVKNIIVNGDLALVGPHTGPGNIYLGPLLYYLAVPFFWAFKLHPLAGSVLASVLGIATAIGIYILFKKFFTQNLALLALALYATSPLFNVNDRTIWNPSLILPASLGVLGSFLSWSKTRQITYFNLAVLATSVALGIQAHLGFLFIIPLVILMFWQFKPKGLTIFRLFWFIVIFIFWFAPLIAFDLRHQGINTANLVKFAFSTQNSTRFDLINFLNRFISLILSQLQLIGSVLIYSAMPLFNLIAGIILVTLALIFLLPLYPLMLKLFLSYLVTFATGFALYAGNIPDYYLWPILLPSVLIIALVVDTLIRRFRLHPTIFLATLAFFLLFRTLDQLSIFPPDSLSHKVQAVKYIISQAKHQPFRVVYDTDFGRYYGFAYLFDYFEVKLSDNSDAPTFTIVIPEFFRTGVRSNMAFGSIGIINPKHISE